MSCIHCYSPSLKLLTLHMRRQNAGKNTNHLWFSGYSTNKHSTIISQVRVVPLKVVDFATSLNLAVAKPPNTQVLIQTSALLIFFYLIANFAVPQFLSKSLHLHNDKVDENDSLEPKTDSEDEVTTSSKASTGGFNSKKPK